MNKSEKITFLAEINIPPGFEQEILQAAATQIKATRAGPGCETAILNTKKDDAAIIYLFEIFKSADEMETHKLTPHTKAFGEALKGKVEGDTLKINFMDQYAL